MLFCLAELFVLVVWFLFCAVSFSIWVGVGMALCFECFWCAGGVLLLTCKLRGCSSMLCTVGLCILVFGCT